MKHIIKGAALSFVMAVFALAGFDARAECDGEESVSCDAAGGESDMGNPHGDDDDLMVDHDFMGDELEFEIDSCFELNAEHISIRIGGNVIEGDVYEGEVHYGDVYSETHYHKGKGHRMHRRPHPEPWTPPFEQLAPFDELDQNLDGAVSQEEYLHYQVRTSGPVTPPMIDDEEEPHLMMDEREMIE